jgi:hypothetical protein
MSCSAEIRVVPVPVQMVPEMWEPALPHLVRGDEAARTNPVKLLLDLISSHAVLWVVFVNDALVAAYFSSIHVEDDGNKELMVYGLGGGALRVWLRTMIATMEQHARANGCLYASFHGVGAWSRLVPEYTATPTGDGVALYRRALS